MESKKTTASSPMILGIAIFFTMLALAGCKKSDDSAGAPGASSAVGAADAGAADAGKLVFTSNGCKGCHSIGGQGGQKAPDLSHTGAESTHTAEWFANFVGNPKASNPQSRMPAFKGRISDKDLQALGAYLTTLK